MMWWCFISGVIGDKEEIKTFISQLEESGLFFNEDAIYRRSINFLFLINTNCNLRNFLENDSTNGHLTDAFLTLSVPIYFGFVTKFELWLEFQECIVYLPPSVSVELIELLECHVKFVPYETFFVIIQNVVTSIHKVISSLPKNNSNRFPTAFINNVGSKFYELFKSFVLAFNISKIPSQFSNLKKDQLIELAGHRFLSLINLLNDCRQDFTPYETLCKFYGVTIPEFDYSVWPCSESEDLKELAYNCYETILLKCKACFNELNINCYVAWHEISHSKGTLQTAIRLAATDLLFFIRSNSISSVFKPLLDSEFKSMLASLEITSEVDDTKSDEQPFTNYDENLKENLKYLLTYSNVFKSAFISKLKSNISYLDAELVELLVNRAYEAAITSASNRTVEQTELLNVTVATLQQMEWQLLSNLMLDETTKVRIANILNTSPFNATPLYINGLFSDDEYNIHETEEGRKVINQIAPYMLVQAEAVLRELLKSAICSKNEECANVVPHSPPIVIAMRILKATKLIWLPAASHDSQNTDRNPLLITLTNMIQFDYVRNYDNTDKDYFHQMICLAFENGILTKSDFLSHCILNALSIGRIVSWTEYYDWLKLLEHFLPNNDVETIGDEVMVSLLVSLAELMDNSRWTMYTFSADRINVCDQCALLIRKIFKLSVVDVDMFENAFKNGCYAIRSLSEITRSYFREYLQDDELVRIDSISSLLHLDSQNQTEYFSKSANRRILVLFISKILSVCSACEVHQMAARFISGNRQSSLYLMYAVRDAITLLANFFFCKRKFHNPVDDDDEAKCLTGINDWFGYILNTYIHFIQNICMPSLEREDANCVAKMSKHLIFMTAKLNDGRYGDTSELYYFNVIKFISELLQSDLFSASTESDARELLVSLSALSRFSLKTEQ